MGKTTDIREAVEAELEFDPLVDPSDITVKNINGQVSSVCEPSISSLTDLIAELNVNARIIQAT